MADEWARPIPAVMRLLAGDLDGTLLDQSGAIHEVDRRAIVELRRHGVTVTVVTGRMYSGTRDIARRLELDEPVCRVDGSAIVAVDGDRGLLSRPIAGAAAAALRAIVAATKVPAFLLGRDAGVHDERGAPFVPYMSAWSPRVSGVDDILAARHWDDEAAVSAVVSVGAESEIRGLGAEIARAAGELVEPVVYPVGREAFRGRWAVITRAAGVSKGTALRCIAAHHGVDMRDVVAVGHWLNHISLLEAAGRSFAMAHAPAALKAAATDQLRADVRSGGGIAEAAARAGLLP